MNINQSHVRRFKRIVDSYSSLTSFPKRNAWKNKGNKRLWLDMVVQVMVVGNSRPAEIFIDQRQDLQEKIDYDRLRTKNNPQRKKIIHEVLREAGVRYASYDIDKCAKTSALFNNFNFINKNHGNFEGLLNYLASIKGKNAEQERVNYLMSNLQFLKNKSARDFLMGMGMNRNTLALDIRIQNIFNHLGIDFPTQAGLYRNNIYVRTEMAIIEKICKPLQIEPMKFDRILYQNYEAILRRPA